MAECDDLTMNTVSIANRARCKRWHPGFPNDTDWTGADWALAMGGETGEALNVVKKLRRIEVGIRGVMDPSEAELRAALADELADIYLYLDLLAAKYDIDLPSAVASKFNRVSAREGFPERLAPLRSNHAIATPMNAREIP
jgi:NTP pyrophosphatase (non-canonical NTP hydrolase)